MKTELAPNGYEKIDGIIQEIEDLAYSGIFTGQDRVSLFQGIASETKMLRQTLRDVLLLVPDTRAAAITTRTCVGGKTHG